MSEGIRLNKYLSESGVCSRREADTHIEKGNVKINGVTAVMGQKVMPGDAVSFMGKTVQKKDRTVILAYNKPIGLTCTASKADPDSIFDHIDYPIRLQYVGRLDKDSQGLLLLTNDGDLSNAIQKSVNNHEKEYRVRVNKPVTEDFLLRLSGGVPILDTVTKKCKVKKIDDRSFSIVLTQGLNRQIRRMCETLGYRVVNLKRVRVCNVKLGNLRPGELRRLTFEEEQELRRIVGM
ncbi:MAG: pseudouridine synthase [Coprococcus sp.]|nr:pseudouridine synthase [Coprococcus sp.]